MYFKIEKGTETFKKLQELHTEIISADMKALKLSKKLKGLRYCATYRAIGGGISAIEFKQKPEGWKVVGEKWQQLYMPKSTMKDVWKEISALPVIEYDKLNKIVGFEGNQTVSTDHGLAWVNTVGITWGEEVMLMHTTKGTKYSPGEDIKEILESEYVALEKTIKEARPKKKKK